jgi:hypothetical protein
VYRLGHAACLSDSLMHDQGNLDNLVLSKACHISIDVWVLISFISKSSDLGEQISIRLAKDRAVLGSFISSLARNRVLRPPTT